jgi:16S rRNA (uracil1498-N3)-methyltransferase
LEKAVEVGVTRIVPFAARRSNGAPARRWDRWHRILVEAAKQSKRYRLPALREPVMFAEALNLEARTKILFAERGGGLLKPALSGSPDAASRVPLLLRVRHIGGAPSVVCPGETETTGGTATQR